MSTLVRYTKRRGSLYLSLIPHSGLRIAFPKDKQRSQPTSDILYNPFGNKDKGVQYTLRERFVAVSSWVKVCEVLSVEDNVRKRPLPVNTPPALCGLTELVAKLSNKNIIT